MPWSRSWCELHKRGIVRGESASSRVDPVGENSIQPQISYQYEPVVRGQRDHVRMRSALAFLVYARSGVLEKCGRFAQRSVLMNRKRGHAAAAVIRSEQQLPGLVDGDMTWSRTARRNSIEQLQSMGGGVDREGAHATGCLTFIHRDFIRGIQEALVRMNRQERRILRFRHQTNRRRLTGRTVEAISVDALARRARVRSDVHRPVAG